VRTYWLHITQHDAKGKLWAPCGPPQAPALQLFIVISCVFIHSGINAEVQLLVLVFHKYCSGELAEFNYSYHEIASINQMPVAAVFCSFESKKLFKNYFIKSRKLF